MFNAISKWFTQRRLNSVLRKVKEKEVYKELTKLIVKAQLMSLCLKPDGIEVPLLINLGKVFDDVTTLLLITRENDVDYPFKVKVCSVKLRVGDVLEKLNAFILLVSDDDVESFKKQVKCYKEEVRQRWK